MEKLIQYRTKDSLYDGPFNSTVGWAAAGMGNVIVTENGRLIVIDGGNTIDAEDFVSLLKAQSHDKKVEIDLWIITHPHLDHYGAIQEICRMPELAEWIRVKKFVYWFPEEFCSDDGVHNSIEAASNDLAEICGKMNAEAYRPSRDETFIVDGMEIHFFYVPDDCSIFNSAGKNANYCSLIFTIKGKNKKTMITGDAYGRSMQITAWRYANALKCDILQMPHHALCDAYCVDFYNYVNPDIVLMPISVAGYRAMHTEYSTTQGGIANLCVEAKAKEVYKAFDGTVEILL